MKSLVVLYEEMASLTKPECEKCRLPYQCCSPDYCQFTIAYAKESWRVTLQTTDHPTLPLMGEKGCTVAPHLRPLCTVHTCQIAALGCKPGDAKWTNRYFKLRDQISKLEDKRLPLQ